MNISVLPTSISQCILQLSDLVSVPEFDFLLSTPSKAVNAVVKENHCF